MSNSRGKNPATLLHDWVMIATFAIGQHEVDQLAAARVDPSGEGSHQIPLTNEKVRTLDGPGCSRCNLEWKVGYGHPCAGKPSTADVLAGVPDSTIPNPLLLPDGQPADRARHGGLYLPEGMRMPSNDDG